MFALWIVWIKQFSPSFKASGCIQMLKWPILLKDKILPTFSEIC